MRLVTLFGTFGLAASIGCTGDIAADADNAAEALPNPGDEPAKGASTKSVSQIGPSIPAAKNDPIVKGDPPGKTDPPPVIAACGAAVGPAPARRLTRTEYKNSVRDLLGDTASMADQFSPDGRLGAFDSNVDAPATPLAVNDYLDAADALSLRALSRLDTLLPCKSVGLPRDQEDACARSFIRTFGKRAFRRPMVDTEIDRYAKVYTNARVSRGRDFANGVRLILATMLQSPHFLNHVERGVPAGKPGLYALTPYELASRLSYALWQTSPDDALMAAADSGKLGTPADLEREARRMMADPRTKAGLGAFYDQFLSLGRLDSLNKAKSFGFNPGVAAAMRKETQALVGSVLWDGDGKLSTLLTASHTFVNATLATSIYSLKNVTGDALKRTEMNPTERAGILTQPSFLAIWAHSDETDPIHRGKFVRERLFCQEMPSPPANIVVVPPKPDPTQTTRQRYSSMLEISPCSGCHRLMNLIGLGFENYDAVGRFRSIENGLPVDATGEIVGTPQTDGPFSGARDLGTKLASSRDVGACMSRTWYSYVIGHEITSGDKCSVDQLQAEFERSSGNLRDIFLAVVKTDGFRFRSDISTEVCQ